MKHYASKNAGYTGRHNSGPKKPHKSHAVWSGGIKSRVHTSAFAHKHVPNPEIVFEAEVAGFKCRSGGWAWGCCPFHDDHNPSFCMNLDSGGYKCMSSSCGVSGNSIVSFVSALHGLTRAQAYRYLEALA